MKSDGTIVAWGDNWAGQCNVPPPNGDFVAIAAGRFHSLGVKSDGTASAWGDNSRHQCDAPSPNAGFTAVAAGGYHSLYLKSNGTIVARGWVGTISNVTDTCPGERPMPPPEMTL